MDPTTNAPANGASSQPSAASPSYLNGAHQHDDPDASTISALSHGSARSPLENNKAKLPWSQQVWERIDKAVELEFKRTCIAAQFLPKISVPPDTITIPTDSYAATVGPKPVLTADARATICINEYYVEFELTPQQVDQEEGSSKQLGHSTAVTLAAKAANLLAQAEDLIVFQGVNAIHCSHPFTSSLVLHEGSPADTGLLNQPLYTTAGVSPTGAGPLSPQIIVIQVPRLSPPVPGVLYGPNTFEAVSKAYSLLQTIGHHGPYALAVQTTPYADTYAPLPSASTLTASRINPLATAGFFGAAALPPNPSPPPAPPALPIPPGPPFFGVFVSLGGYAVDLVTSLDPVVAFIQQDSSGNFRFRVLERFALRIKDTTAIVVCKFE